MDDGENDSEAKVYKSQDSDEIDEREKYFEVDGKLVQQFMQKGNVIS